MITILRYDQSPGSRLLARGNSGQAGGNRFCFQCVQRSARSLTMA
jgi:hypothetical protein